MAIGSPFPGIDSSGFRDPDSLKLKVVDQAGRLALTGMVNGFTVFDTTVKKQVTYYSTKWYLPDGNEAATS